jgi:5-methylthioadenosine/S-adenosylhomocysteine deaminase
MIKSGTTLFNDMYWHFHGTARAVEEMGIRAVISAVFIDFDDSGKRAEQQKINEQLFRESKRYSSRIQFALGPHAIYTVSGESLKWIEEFSQQYNLLVHLHLSETKKEVEDCISKYGLFPVEYLNSLGCLESRLLACHAVWLEDKELDILRDHRVTLVYNPTSNLKLAVGKIFRYPQIKKRGIPICIGTDGCASNNNLDMLETLKIAALLQKWSYNDPTLLPCHEIWEIATQKAHQALNVEAGVIAEGKLADIMLIDMQNVQMVPNHDMISNLVYSASGAVVDTVICNGKILMQDGEVPGEKEILHKAAEVAYRAIRRV